jgi:hypothetical protein
MLSHYVNDLWLVRRLPSVLFDAGFGDLRVRGHGYVQTDQPVYMLGVINRGADLLVSSNVISAEFAEAIKAEARRRADEGRFFGSTPFVSVIAQRP